MYNCCAFQTFRGEGDRRVLCPDTFSRVARAPRKLERSDYGSMHEELDTHHKFLCSEHKQSTPRAGEGLAAGAARLFSVLRPRGAAERHARRAA